MSHEEPPFLKNDPSLHYEELDEERYEEENIQLQSDEHLLSHEQHNGEALQNEEYDDVLIDEDNVLSGMEESYDHPQAANSNNSKHLEAATLMTMMQQQDHYPHHGIGVSQHSASTSSVGSTLQKRMMYEDHQYVGSPSAHYYSSSNPNLMGSLAQIPSISGPNSNNSNSTMFPPAEYYAKRPPPPPPRIQYQSANKPRNNNNNNTSNNSSSKPASRPPVHSLHQEQQQQHTNKVLNQNEVTTTTKLNNLPIAITSNNNNTQNASISSRPSTGRGSRGGRVSGRGRGRGRGRKSTNDPSRQNSSPIILDPVPNLPVFTGYIALGLDDDKYWLSELQCYLRSHFAEAFGANESDIAAPMHGRNKPVSLGQVGIRCMHCRDDPIAERGQQAVSYPSLISGIYNSVQQMLRLHFDCCLAIPLDVRRKIEQLKQSSSARGGRKQYWMDSAKRLGLIDTPHGIYFERDPVKSPLPPLFMSSTAVNNPSPGISLEVSKVNSKKGKKNALQNDINGFLDGKTNSKESVDQVSKPSETNDPIEPPKPSLPLVYPEDKPLISDYLYLTLQQMQPCTLMDADRVGCYKGRQVGFPGIACKHCVGQAGCGRYFPASEASLSQTTTSQTILNHVRNCRRCPIEIRESLELMKRAKFGPDGKKADKPKHGGRKVFFHRLWCRIQGLMIEEDGRNEDDDDEENIGTKKKGAKKKRNVKKRKTVSRRKNLDEDSHSALTSMSESSIVASEEDIHDDDDDDDDDDESSDSENEDGNSSSMSSSDSESDDSDLSRSSAEDEMQGEEGIIYAKCGLCKSDDSLFLSDLHCFLRSTMLEVFTVTEEEAEDPNNSLSPDISAGNVGIRCIFCSKSENPCKGYVNYPSSINNIYTVANDIQRRHFPNCTNMPEKVASTFKSLKTSTLVSKSFNDGSGVDTHQYWIDAAKDLGLADCDSGSGVVFARDPTLPSPADMLSLNSMKTKIDLIQLSDRGKVTDFTALLIKQVRPCYFTKKDIRKGIAPAKDRNLGFPGIACKHCSNTKEQRKNQASNASQTTIGRYFPSSPKSLADNTSHSIYAHVTNCTRCPDDIKSSLVYLTHRSLLQKSELASGWKRMFYKRVWERLHNHYSIDESFQAITDHNEKNKKASHNQNVTRSRRGKRENKKLASASQSINSDAVPSTILSSSPMNSKKQPFEEEEVGEEFESEVSDVINAAAIWLAEHEKVNAMRSPIRATRGTTLKRTGLTTLPKSGRGAFLPTQKRRRGQAEE